MCRRMSLANLKSDENLSGLTIRSEYQSPCGDAAQRSQQREATSTSLSASLRQAEHLFESLLKRTFEGDET
jgi:hypothetical protein